MEADADLKDPLRNLGITDMFDSSKANFTKITSKWKVAELQSPYILSPCQSVLKLSTSTVRKNSMHRHREEFMNGFVPVFSHKVATFGACLFCAQICDHHF